MTGIKPLGSLIVLTNRVGNLELRWYTAGLHAKAK